LDEERDWERVDRSSRGLITAQDIVVVVVRGEVPLKRYSIQLVVASLASALEGANGTGEQKNDDQYEQDWLQHVPAACPDEPIAYGESNGKRYAKEHHRILSASDVNRQKNPRYPKKYAEYDMLVNAHQGDEPIAYGDSDGKKCKEQPIPFSSDDRDNSRQKKPRDTKYYVEKEVCIVQYHHALRSR
jgi:hypothetical protein